MPPLMTSSSAQPPNKHSRPSFHHRTAATNERLDLYEPGIVNSRIIGTVNNGRHAAEPGMSRSPQKGRTAYNPPPSWPSSLNLTDDSELGLGEGFGDDEWEDWDEGGADAAKKKEAPASPRLTKTKRVCNESSFCHTGTSSFHASGTHTWTGKSTISMNISMRLCDMRDGQISTVQKTALIVSQDRRHLLGSPCTAVESAFWVTLSVVGVASVGTVTTCCMLLRCVVLQFG